MDTLKKFIRSIVVLSVFTVNLTAQQCYLVPTGNSQSDFLKAYKLAFKNLDSDFRNANTNSLIFGKYSEFSVYYAVSGSNAGSFIMPDQVPAEYSNVASTAISSFNWNTGENVSLQFKCQPKKIGIFKSSLKVNENTVSWEAYYFLDLFNTYLFDNCHYFTDEPQISSGISDSTALLIIPAFVAGESSNKEYIDSVALIYPQMKQKIESFLARGGVIYTEGNAAYFLEAIGIVEKNSFDFNNVYQPASNGIIYISATSGNPLVFSAGVNANKEFSASLPLVSISSATVSASLTFDSRPVIFTLEGSVAKGGKIICNLGLPLVSGMSDASGLRQLQYTLDAMVYAFSKKIDVTRSVRNVLLGSLATTPANTISFDRIDTFDVNITIRNLSTNAASNIIISENIPSFLNFIGSVSGSFSNGKLNINVASLAANTEQTITYQLSTPDPDDPVHETINNSVINESLLNAANNSTSYNVNNTVEKFEKNKAYANAVFSARIMADADVNWKNFLGVGFQPFKVFTIMENKERTAAEQTEYIQYIPKDVPFYQSDGSLNIPILKTPGGKFIDVLKGSNDKNNPEFDFDADGDPDVWLDTASIYPKGFTLTEDSVYWANPWSHLKTGSDEIVYEDINHDGITAKDLDSDGIVDVEAPGDKIRVWKITWNIGRFEGHQYFDPYCSYEIWVDAPDLVGLAAGVGYVNDSVPNPVSGMFYPNTANIALANKADTAAWAHWMEHNQSGKVIWKQFIYQKQHNYEGYTFIDTLAENYRLKPWDSLAGTTPQPHNEFIAVLSMGGEEIDMRHPTPSQSLYSKVKYKTILDEQRVTPIRTTYTYYAPLPNPLQFEYLSSTFSISDTTGKPLDVLPKLGKAQLQFDLLPSTEYSYYWIRNFGYHVDYNSPSLAIDSIDGLGDGVFGYFIYDIPKGMGGYNIILPKNTDGSYDINSIVQIDGKPFAKWIDNVNTANAVEIWEDPFQYHVYIPQILIPPALDDDNGDGIDDWIDDRGDRISSSTGFLHDAFMKGDGEQYLSYPPTPYIDDYGTVTKGWYFGQDNEPGDDKFEDLGKTHITIHAIYEGKGREGSVDISKGGTLVCEEIFGGSPWVIFAHVHSAFAEGARYQLTSKAMPSTIKFGGDTIYIKHEITDKDEPHYFNAGFDPYIMSAGYTDASITTIAGGKDPCSLVSPAISTHTIIDPAYDKTSVTLLPQLIGYTKTDSGAFLSIKVEVSNLSADNWKNVSVQPVLTNAGGSTTVLSYVAYPRPLVPNDNIGEMNTGWRFNQPEGEVIVKLGDTLNTIQPTRRAYFIYLVKVPSVNKGIYEIGFNISGEKVHYNGTNNGTLNYTVPSAKFSVVEKTSGGAVTDFSKMVIGPGKLDSLIVSCANFSGSNDVKWSATDVDFNDFGSITGKVPAVTSGGDEIIDITSLKTLPNADTAKLFLLEKGITTVKKAADSVIVTNQSILNYMNSTGLKDTAKGNSTSVIPLGPFTIISNSLYAINGQRVTGSIPQNSNIDMTIVSVLKATNIGNIPSGNTNITLYYGPDYNLLIDSISNHTEYTVANNNGNLTVDFGIITPGESRQILVYYKIKANTTQPEDVTLLIDHSDVQFTDNSQNSYLYTDPTKLRIFVFEFAVDSLVYSNNGQLQVTVSASAINMGITAYNVWFRIYPVVNDGLREFPFAELLIDTFRSGQVITLSGNYTIPAGEKLEFVAVIDDNKQFSELLKLNNELTKDYTPTGIAPVNGNKYGVNISPNPFSNLIKVDMILPENTSQALFTVFNVNGSIVCSQLLKPYNGKANAEINFEMLSSGAFIFKIVTMDANRGMKVYSGQLIKK